MATHVALHMPSGCIDPDLDRIQVGSGESRGSRGGWSEKTRDNMEVVERKRDTVSAGNTWETTCDFIPVHFCGFCCKHIPRLSPCWPSSVGVDIVRGFHYGGSRRYGRSTVLQKIL